MAVRSVVWRRVCSERVASVVEDALKMTLYLVHQTGPTGFVLKEEREKNKIKVCLGDPHTCTCSCFKKTKELCAHILWVLLKKFRIPRTNPVIWQLGLVEREINEIVYEHLRCQSPTLPDAPPTSKLHPHTSQKARIKPKEINNDDVCPICQDDLVKDSKKLTYCRFSCGKSMHVKCMRIWSDHQKSMGEQIVKCPLCRQEFGSIITLALSNNGGTGTALPPGGREKPHHHLGTACSHCHICPVVGKCYKCVVCPSYFLCHKCYSTHQVHLLHSFLARQHCSHPWRPALRMLCGDPQPTTHSHSTSLPLQHPLAARREVGGAFPPSFVQSLQARSLTEADYEMLVSLDRQIQNLSDEVLSRSPGEANTVWLPTELLEATHPLVVGGASCGMCQLLYNRGDWVATLTCKHQFHQECLANWTAASRINCPYDNLPIKTHPLNQRPLHQPGTLAAISSSSTREDIQPPPGLQRRVRGRANMLLSKATTTVDREDSEDRLKLGIAGTKLTIGNSHHAHGASPHSTAAPAGAMATSPSHTHRFPTSKKNPPGAAKFLKTGVVRTVKGKATGLTSLVNGRRNGSRAREEMTGSPIQIASRAIYIPNTSGRS